MTWGEAANLAVNQTLMRSINTSVIALLPVAGLLFVGAGLLGVGTLKDLALVLFVGLAAGTYSSIFLATPIVADLKEREPEQIELRKRVLARRAAAARQRPSDDGRQRAGRGARREGAVAVADRDALPGKVAADVVVESPASVRREPGSGGSLRAAAGSAAAAAGQPAVGQEAAVSQPSGDVVRADGAALTELIAALTVDVPDYPEPGIALPRPHPGLRRRRRLLRDGGGAGGAGGLRPAGRGGVRRRDGTAADPGFDVVVGVEARGFLLAAAVALATGVGVVPVRKAGKLPRERVSADYSLEYGTATLELHADSVLPGQRVLVVDDVLATGGRSAPPSRWSSGSAEW